MTAESAFVHALFGFCPTLSGGDESRAHENTLFYVAESEATLPDLNTRTNHIGFCTAAVYLGEQLGVAGATHQTVERDDEVVCLHSPEPGLWVGLVAANVVCVADTEQLHLLLEKAMAVFRLRHGTAAVRALTDPHCPAAERSALELFFQRFLLFLNLCVFPSDASSEATKQLLFPYPTRSWYAVAAFDAIVGYEPYHYGGRNDIPRLALRCGTVVHRRLAQHLGWPTDARSPHYAVFDVMGLRVLTSSLPPHVAAQLRLHWLLGADPTAGEGDGRRLRQCFLRLGGEEVAMDVLTTHVSVSTVTILMRAKHEDSCGENQSDAAAEEDRAVTCAAAVADDVSELLKPILPLDTLRALPLLAAARPPPPGQRQDVSDEELRQPSPLYTGEEVFWLLWSHEGLQGCALSELNISVARDVGRVMRRMRCEGGGGAGVASDDDSDDDSNAARFAETRMVGESGLLEVCRRRWDGAVLAVLVAGVPRLPARFAHIAAVKATLGF